MDKEQEALQFLGFFGIFKESFKIISTYRKIFAQITLAIIVPISVVFLSEFEISKYFFGDILYSIQTLHFTNVTRSQWITFVLFKIVFFIFNIVLSLLSTSAMVYTVACIYTAKVVTFEKVISVVPKVWKRLLVTFIWTFFITSVFNFVAILSLVIIFMLVGNTIFGLAILAMLAIVFIAIFVCTSVVWKLACAVSVLEDAYGIQAILKSKDLIKGKIGVAILVFLTRNLCIIGILIGFKSHVFLLIHKLFVVRLMYAMFFFLLLVVLALFGLVVQTVIYFVCKSFHHESIDKSTLADHLQVYLGDYVPLESKDVQLEHSSYV